MSLEHLIVPGYKETLKQDRTKSYGASPLPPKLLHQGMSEEHRNQLKELPVAKVGIVSASK